MSAKQLIFSALRGTVKTIEKVVEETPAGEKVEKQVVKMVQLLEGQPLPKTTAPDEVDRLKRLGVVVEEGQPTGTSTAIAAAKLGKTPKEVANGAASGSGEEVSLDLSKLADYADDELADLWSKHAPTISAALDAVGTDAALAEKVLAAEKTATKGDPRKGLVTGVEKVIAEAAAGGSGGGQE